MKEFPVSASTPHSMRLDMGFQGQGVGLWSQGLDFLDYLEFLPKHTKKWTFFLKIWNIPKFQLFRCETLEIVRLMVGDHNLTYRGQKNIYENFFVKIPTKTFEGAIWMSTYEFSPTFVTNALSTLYFIRCSYAAGNVSTRSSTKSRIGTSYKINPTKSYNGSGR